MEGSLPPTLLATSWRRSTIGDNYLHPASRALPRPHTPATARCGTHRTRGREDSGPGVCRPVPWSARGPPTPHPQTGVGAVSQRLGLRARAHSSALGGANEQPLAPGGSPGRRSSGRGPRLHAPGPGSASLTSCSFRPKMTTALSSPSEPSGKPSVNPRAARGPGPQTPPAGAGLAPRSF